jgi:Fe-S-cluster containining protein
MCIARATGLSTDEVVREYTMRRGSILRFRDDGSCSFLGGWRCTVHDGRPLACRLYPLALQRNPNGTEDFVRLEPAIGSLGLYGPEQTIADFLQQQGVRDCLLNNDRYKHLLSLICTRISALVDFETVEPREFWRVATREALAETNFDPNPLIDALFDADRHAPSSASLDATVAAHVGAVEAMISCESRPAILATAAVMLAVSLGYSPCAAAPAA